MRLSPKQQGKIDLLRKMGIIRVEKAPEYTLLPNRKEARRQKKVRGRDGARTGTRTGSPDWFERMRFEQETRKILIRVPLDRLEPAVGRAATDLYNNGWPNVWAVSQEKDVQKLLHYTTGTDLERLKKYLDSQNVKTNWKV